MDIPAPKPELAYYASSIDRHIALVAIRQWLLPRLRRQGMNDEDARIVAFQWMRGSYLTASRIAHSSDSILWSAKDSASNVDSILGLSDRELLELKMLVTYDYQRMLGGKYINKAVKTTVDEDVDNESVTLRRVRNKVYYSVILGDEQYDKLKDGTDQASDAKNADATADAWIFQLGMRYTWPFSLEEGPPKRINTDYYDVLASSYGCGYHAVSTPITAYYDQWGSLFPDLTMHVGHGNIAADLKDAASNGSWWTDKAYRQLALTGEFSPSIELNMAGYGKVLSEMLLTALFDGGELDQPDAMATLFITIDEGVEVSPTTRAMYRFAHTNGEGLDLLIVNSAGTSLVKDLESAEEALGDLVTDGREIPAATKTGRGKVSARPTARSKSKPRVVPEPDPEETPISQPTPTARARPRPTVTRGRAKPTPEPVEATAEEEEPTPTPPPARTTVGKTRARPTVTRGRGRRPEPVPEEEPEPETPIPAPEEPEVATPTPVTKGRTASRRPVVVRGRSKPAPVEEPTPEPPAVEEESEPEPVASPSATKRPTIRTRPTVLRGRTSRQPVATTPVEEPEEAKEEPEDEETPAPAPTTMTARVGARNKAVITRGRSRGPVAPTPAPVGIGSVPAPAVAASAAATLPPPYDGTSLLYTGPSQGAPLPTHITTMLQSVRNIPGISFEQASAPDEQGRITRRSMTRFERAKIIGLRAEQLAKNRPPMVPVAPDELDVVTIAARELLLVPERFPFHIERTLPSGVVETFAPTELHNTHWV